MDPAVVVRIHPGQYICVRIRKPLSQDSVMSVAFRLLLLIVVAPLVGSTPLTGQVATQSPDTFEVEVGSGDALGAARAAQALFERRRVRLLPLSAEPGGGHCDENVGRFCISYGEGEWFPLEEVPEIVHLRRTLLASLDSLQGVVLEEGWILGQRVWYRSEAGDWTGAVEAARGCGRVERWWCRALEGFSLHGAGRYRESEAAFAEALRGMDDERAREWRVPRWGLDGTARDLLEDAEHDPGAEARLLERLWRLADPLYLVEGNDRRTAHYARWTVATIRERARNPFHIRWGPDLDQLTVRHGWEVGWERTPTRDFTALDNVVGHKHPEGRDFLPSGRVVADPVSATPASLTASRIRPRSLYAPEYAPVLLPMEGQVAFFPRGQTTWVVASLFLPEDTTYHVGHLHPLPWMEAGDQEGMADRIGLFADPIEGGAPRQTIRSGTTDGALMLEVPTGAYVISAESWSPTRRRAGRLRRGVAARPAPEDVATLSDILLVRPGRPDPESLEEAVQRALPRAAIRPGESFGIVWEVVGLGFRPEVLDFELSVRRTDRGVLRRVGEFLGLNERARPLALSWEEVGPDRPTHMYRSLNLDLPALEEGVYELRLVMRTLDRSDVVSTLAFIVSNESR